MPVPEEQTTDRFSKPKRTKNLGGQPLLAVLVIMTAISLTGCRTTSTAETIEADWYCHAFQPITWSKSDTDQTIQQISAHNSVWDALCEPNTRG